MGNSTYNTGKTSTFFTSKSLHSLYRLRRNTFCRGFIFWTFLKLGVRVPLTCSSNFVVVDLLVFILCLSHRWLLHILFPIHHHVSILPYNNLPLSLTLGVYSRTQLYFFRYIFCNVYLFVIHIIVNAFQDLVRYVIKYNESPCMYTSF